ncbi:restriction endonuclease subunit S [Weeksella virosa]|uniref:Restriction modification system DNA specificity domain protein n=1 Tax=Weeksella virosa (strain ATCC 43766 / DSM 16922 / JCM 21250 / CCUG 30538 / CDC 9751 / IAM 14551 / NBRC 16016 / NCTC 11634 / CL345/78) TaxID=865938 RepID=F0P2R5_WEEVC|nr:restriction endonuclease subunit S [Weeksella virosa]ADX66805.1 restriction modification system DNA specificity domain protein [Weeksella virosa DSM 16922]VEH63471.1 Type I restriction enzyme specificity protein MPN_089 [Weeksella virosa]
MSYLENLLQGVEVEWKTLGEVVDIANTGVDKKINADELTVRLLNFVDVFKNQYISNDTPTMIVTATERKIADCNVKKGDVFITPTSELIDEIGFSAMAIEDFDNVVYSYHIMRLRINNQNYLFPAYLNYLFKSKDIRKQIRKKAQGITRYGLTQPNWKSIQIPIPPLDVQQEIVRILDRFTELTAELTARQKQYEYYREQLLMVNDEGLMNNEKVEWKKLGEIAVKISSGGTPSTSINDYYDGDIPWLRTQEVDFKDIWDTEIKITEAGLKNSSAKIIPENCVIVAMYGATVGKIGINKIPLSTNQACANIHVDENIANYRYVFHYLSSKYEHIKSLGTGTQTNINAQIIKNYLIPVPPLAEQERIVAILDKFDTLTSSITEGLPREIELRQKQYEYYRDQLLMFNG